MFSRRIGNRWYPRRAVAALCLLVALLVPAAEAQEPSAKAPADNPGKKDSAPAGGLWTVLLAGLVGLAAGFASAQFNSYLGARN